MSIVPHLFSGFENPMSFWSRVKNTLYLGIELIATQFYYHFERSYYRKHFPSPTYPTFDEMLGNVSLILVNAHFSQGITVPRVPNMVEIGGIQIKEKLDPLSENIKKFLDNSVNGTVYFSLGSNMKSTMLPEETLHMLMDVFRSLDMQVIFKWESDEPIPLQPSNVFTDKWLPQNEVLGKFSCVFIN